MSKALFRIYAYLRHLFSSRYTLGYGIHSPHLFYIARAILPETCRYYAFDAIERKKGEMLCSKAMVYVEDYGTGTSGKRKVSRIARSSLKPSRQAQLLMRLAVHTKASRLVELGTCLGISTAYMASADSRAEVTTFEGSQELVKLAEKNWRELGLHNIRCVAGGIDATLPEYVDELRKKGEDSVVDMAFLDANHTCSATLRYFEQLLPFASAQSVYVLDDIHASREMESAWKRICQMTGVTATFDLFDMGLVFFDPHFERKTYRIRM